MDTAFKAFFTKIQQSLIPSKSKILVGLSGGPDSVFLLHALLQLKEELSLELFAAHLNHEWRECAVIDQEFCMQLCKDLHVPITIKTASQLDISKLIDRGSKEDTARQMRRLFFEQTAKDLGCDLIALGHNLDDQEENFFIRLIRGTSLSGLTGIKSKTIARNGISYIRPLLEMPKKDILEYLNKNNLKFVVDPTNASQNYLRNRIRNSVITAIRKCDSRFDDNFISTLGHLQQADDFIKKYATQKLQEISTNSQINFRELLKNDLFIQKEIVTLWLINNGVKFTLTDNFIGEILKFFNSSHGGTHTFNNWQIKKTGQFANIMNL